MFLSILIKFSVITVLTTAQINSNFNQIYNSLGDVNIAVILRNCQNNSLQSPYVTQSLINSAVWTVDRVNFLNLVDGLKIGLTVNEVCNEKDKFQAIFQTFEQNGYQIGIISDFKLGLKLRNFAKILNLKHQETLKFHQFLIETAVEFLTNFHFSNITVEAPHELLLEQFSKISRRKSICVHNYRVYKDSPNFEKNSHTLIIFGYYHQLYSFIQNYDEFSNMTTIFLPLDGSIFTEIPLNSYLITPPHYPLTSIYSNSINILPTPIFFEIALPIINFLQNSQFILTGICNDTQFKVDCLRSELKELQETCTEPTQILDLLRIETLKADFVYNIFRMENQSNYNKIANYHIFMGNLTIIESANFESSNSTIINRESCESFQLTYRIFENNPRLWLKNEAWVFGFLSISLLGIFFCIAIFVFFIVCIYRKDILDGNPILTLLLLLTVLMMFGSIFPLCLDGSKSIRNSLCLTKSLSITLSFAGAFSLILSRCILLATASKEIGFMSHIAGPVQSFLCLFIFSVQGALSLQMIYRCHDTFHNLSFVYLLSYNMSLLLLLLCICPLVYRSQRNYREGKYFTISIILITIVWLIWIPNFIIFNDLYRDLILCFGVISTAIVLLATIFIPRTYLMTIAVTRNKLTNTLPSLATTTSALDVYRAGTQPVYDCVNVATVNRCSLASIPQSDLYNCPELPQNDDDYETHCDSPVGSDKVTRF